MHAPCAEKKDERIYWVSHPVSGQNSQLELQYLGTMSLNNDFLSFKLRYNIECLYVAHLLIV